MQVTCNNGHNVAFAEFTKVAASRNANLCRNVATGDAPEALTAFVEENQISILVMGRTGQRSVVGDLLGSVPRSIVSTLPCTVIVTPPSNDWQSDVIA